MNKTKLLTALNTLNKPEWFAFRKFLLMEVKQESEIFLLFSFLQSKKENFAKFDDTEGVRIKYFSNYTHKLFLNLISKLYNILEEWLAYHQFKKEKNSSDLLLLKALNEKGLYKHANQIAEALEKKLEAQNTFDIEKNNNLHQLLNYQYYSDNPIKYKLGAPILQKLTDTFLIQFQEQAILYITELYNWGDVQNHDYCDSIELITSIIYKIKNNPHSKITAELIKLVGQDDLESLQQLKRQLELECFTKGSQLQTLVYLYVLTSGLRFWRKGKYQNAELLSEIYDFGFSSKILLSEGKITQTRFHNIISTLGALRSKDWAYQFVNKWYVNVDTVNTNNSLNLAYAQICFIHKDYEEIIKLTRNLEFDNVEIKMRSLGLELISLYEERANYRNILDNTIHNFKRTLKRNKGKITNNFYHGNINLINFIQKLLKKEFKHINIDLSAYNNLIYRTWCAQALK